MLDAALNTAFTSDPDGYFARNPVAREIFVNGPALLASDASVAANMTALLSNMCAYGSRHWTYEPGNEQQWDLYLSGRGTHTGCIQLATAFANMAQAFGRVAATIVTQPQAARDSLTYLAAKHEIFDFAKYHPQETEQESAILNEHVTRGLQRGSHARWYRMISKAGVADFTGKFGEHRIGGRWNFGDHSVAVVGGMAYDPSFNKSGFAYSTDAMNTTYVDWWVREEREQGVFLNHRWVDIAGQHPPLYEYFVPGTAGRGPRLCGLIAAVDATPGYFGISHDRSLSK